MDPRPPSQSHSVLTKWMGIPDANTAGNVHGGTIMKLCDEVGGHRRHSPLRPARGDRRDGTAHLHRYLTLVALDAEGRPAPVPPVEPQTEDEERRAREAQLRRDNRLHERDQITAERGTPAG